MNSALEAIKITYSSWHYRLLGVATGLAVLAAYAFLGGVLTETQGALFFEANITRIFIFLSLSFLAGLVLPMQVFALRKASFSLRGAGLTGASLLTGLATISCCAPLLLPALLVFLGFSALSVLQVNSFVYQYLIPLSAASILLLVVSLRLVSLSILAVCKIRKG